MHTQQREYTTAPLWLDLVCVKKPASAHIDLLQFVTASFQISIQFVQTLILMGNLREQIYTPNK